MNLETDIIKKIQEDKILQEIMPILENYEAYLVGGYIRNLAMGKTSEDRDIVIKSDNTEKIAREIAVSVKGYFIELDEINHIYRIVFEDKINYIDIAQMVNNSLEDDISRRDLTLNAVFYDFKNHKIIDKFNGLKDIENKIIKGISEENFTDDPLRLLRIFRFASITGFDVDKSLYQMVKTHAHLITKCAFERINLEFMKMLEGAHAYKMLVLLNETGLFDEILPEFREVKKIPPNSHHHLTLFNHSLEVVKQLEVLYQNADEKVKEHLNGTFLNTYSRFAHLKLAGLFHDIGKPSVWVIEEDTNRHRFIKHDEVGAKICVPVLKKLKFSNKQISYIQKMIKYHIYPASLVQQSPDNEKAYFRFMRKINEDAVDLILLSQADRLSARGEAITDDMVKANIDGLNNLLKFYFDNLEVLTPPKRLLTGEEIMQLTGLKQSKELGEIIKSLYEKQLSNEITTKEQAIKFVKK